MAADPDPLRLVATFRERLLRDRIEGRELPLSHYQAQFPGHETVIAREYRDLQEEPTVAAAAGGEPPELQQDGEAPLLGGYRLEREIGRGGQGVVYLATDTHLGRRVAVKVLSRGLLDTTAQRQRFEREATLAARLEHPSIATIYASGTAQGESYVAMQYVEGTSLRHEIERAQARHERPGRDEVLRRVRAFAAVAHAVHAAHELGIVHRDLKPGNLMLTPDGRLVVLDFGLARDLNDDSAQLSRSGDLYGSPAYLAPEQIEGLTRGDILADVYSLGIALYEWLTLQRPFRGATRQALFHAILRAEPPDPRRLTPAIPRDLAAVLGTALAKDRRHRYPSARALALDLEAVAAGRPVAAVPYRPWQRLARWARREPLQATLLSGLVVALLAVAGLAGFFVARRGVLEQGRRALEQREVEQLLGEAFGYQGAFVDFVAVDRLRAALEKDPALILVRLFLAIELASLGESEPAQALLAATVTDPDAAAALARVRRAAAGEASAPLAEAAGPLELYAAGAILVRYAREHRDDREAIDGALEALRRAVLMAPRAEMLYYVEYAEAVAQLARHDRTGAAREGGRVAAALVRLWPHSVMALGWAATLTSDPGRAAQLHLACLELDPDLAGSMIWLARHHVLVEEDLALAQQWYERASAVPQRLNLPDFWRDHLMYADALLARQRRAEALVPLRRAVELEPTEARPYLLLAEILREQGESEEAWIVLSTALEQLPPDTDPEEMARLVELQSALDG